MESIIALTESQLTEIIKRTAKAAVEDMRRDIENAKTPVIMTKADLANYLRCHISKIDRMMRYENLPSISFGSHPRFRRSEIDKWLELAPPATRL